jgi:hypothetical protein
MPWVKLYTEILDDPLIGRLSDSCKWLFVQLILIAGECDSEGYLTYSDRPMTVEDIAWRLRSTPDQLTAYLEQLVQFGLLQFEQQTYLVTNFSRRQGRTQKEIRQQWLERQQRSRHSRKIGNIERLDRSSGNLDRTLGDSERFSQGTECPDRSLGGPECPSRGSSRGTSQDVTHVSRSDTSVTPPSVTQVSQKSENSNVTPVTLLDIEKEKEKEKSKEIDSVINKSISAPELFSSLFKITPNEYQTKILADLERTYGAKVNRAPPELSSVWSENIGRIYSTWNLGITYFLSVVTY